MSHIKKTPKDFKPVYFCPVCSEKYTTEAEARKCFVSTPEPVKKVGDLILLSPRYGWFDGDKEWVVKDTGVDHNGMPLLAFWYVITAIDGDEDYNPHCNRYHVATKALKRQDTAAGFTFSEGHHWEWSEAKKYNPPKAVVAAAKKMVGQTSQRLL